MAPCCWRSWNASRASSGDPDGLLLASQLRLLQQDLPTGDNELHGLLQGDPNDRAAVTKLRKWLRQRERLAGLTLLSHAHLDLAWLWPVADTWQAAERTFRSVLGIDAAAPRAAFRPFHPSALLLAAANTAQRCLRDPAARCSKAAGSR